MADVLAKSSNIGAINIGLKVGEQGLYQYVRRFGFGEKTGIDLPGESAGVVRRVEQWTPSSIGSVAMGHEVSATAVQLAVLGAAIANGGFRLRPQIVLARHKPGQPEERLAPEKSVRAITGETAVTMRQMMEGVVLHGTAKGLANLRGYTSGGKTGSAQIFDLKGRVYTHSYNASFLGFAPVANPRIVIAVTLNGTMGGAAGYGGPVAAPVFREVAMVALRILDVPKDVPDESVSSVTTPPVQNNRDPSVARHAAQIPGLTAGPGAERRVGFEPGLSPARKGGVELTDELGSDLDRRSFLAGVQRRSRPGL
jgi:cell division protein FtsI (penicillin-binding protein 3)